MSQINNLFLFIFISLSFLASFSLLFKGIAKRNPLFLFLSISYLLPMAFLTTISLKEVRVGHWEHYTFIAPLAFLNIYCAMIDFKTAALLRKLLFGFFGIAGLLNYFSPFKNDKFLYMIREKTQVMKRVSGVTNLIFTPHHPYLREISKYYATSYKNYKSEIISAPIDQQGFREFSKIKDVYNGINIIALENSYESSSLETSQDILSRGYIPQKAEFHKFGVSSHPYLATDEERLKILYFIKR